MIALLLTACALTDDKLDCPDGTRQIDHVCVEEDTDTDDGGGREPAETDVDTDVDSDTDGDTDGDTDSDTDSDTDTELPSILSFAAACDLDGACEWTVLSDAAIGSVQLSIIETGDPAFDEGCDDPVGHGGVVCGVWSEYHDEFVLTEPRNEYGGETRALDIEVVAATEDQVGNVTTIFNLADATTTEQMSFELVITDARGSRADCVAGGDLPEFFDCENGF